MSARVIPLLFIHPVIGYYFPTHILRVSGSLLSFCYQHRGPRQPGVIEQTEQADWSVWVTTELRKWPDIIRSRDNCKIVTKGVSREWWIETKSSQMKGPKIKRRLSSSQTPVTCGDLYKQSEPDSWWPLVPPPLWLASESDRCYYEIYYVTREWAAFLKSVQTSPTQMGSKAR